MTSGGARVVWSSVRSSIVSSLLFRDRDAWYFTGCHDDCHHFSEPFSRLCSRTLIYKMLWSESALAEGAGCGTTLTYCTLGRWA